MKTQSSCTSLLYFADTKFDLHQMKTIFIGGEPQLMNPTTLKDMWYIMTEVKMLVEDKEDIDILMPLFDHADADGKPP